MPFREQQACRRLAGAALLSIAFWLASAAPAAAVQRAVAEHFVTNGTDEQHDRVTSDIGARLHAAALRLDLDWSLAEPGRGVYDDDGYLERVDHLVHSAREQNLQVVVTVYGVPRWASDRSFWGDPPAGYSGYQPFYPMQSAALDDFERFAQHLAELLRGNVLAYECWNEPNLWPFLFPQQTRGDSLYAIHTYLKYLKRFSAGVKAGDQQALVIAGATAPTGDNDQFRTSPQRFARELRSLGASDYFDVYSHHPYSVGPTQHPAPGAPPIHPATTVSLSNISTILKVFPEKPFYLTEYGFNTRFSSSFGVTVGEVDQARYLKQAYALAGRHAQIKMLFWFLANDWSSTGDAYDPVGVYTGLRGLDGRAKRAWYAFARGNTITLRAPESADRGASLRLSGAYTCASVGGVKGKPLLLQRRWGHGSWVTLRTLTTGENGSYQTFITLTRSTTYRLVFRGVVNSPAALVRTK